MFNPEDQHINKVITDSVTELTDVLNIIEGDLDVAVTELETMNKSLKIIAECLMHFREIHLDVRASIVE